MLCNPVYAEFFSWIIDKNWKYKILQKSKNDFLLNTLKMLNKNIESYFNEMSKNIKITEPPPPHKKRTKLNFEKNK